MENFGYLERHIKRADAGKRKKGGQLSHSLSVKSASTNNRSTSDDDTSDAEVILDTSDDGMDSDTRSPRVGLSRTAAAGARCPDVIRSLFIISSSLSRTLMHPLMQLVEVEVDLQHKLSHK